MAFDEQPDLTPGQASRLYNRHQDAARGRRAEFSAGHADARPDLQTPTSGPRRAGPLPYPETLEEHLRSEEDVRWSRSH